MDGKWRLYKDGKLFYVRGASANTFYDKVDDFGGNAIRTYGVNDTTQQILDVAGKNGLSVNFGIWIGREQDGFNYNDDAAVKQQLERIRSEVRRFKDHPALLVWSIGNEAEAGYTNLKLWNAVNDIATMIHTEDPDHPTTVALAGADVTGIRALIERAPQVDILSLNSYAPNLPAVLGNLTSVRAGRNPGL